MLGPLRPTAGKRRELPWRFRTCTHELTGAQDGGAVGRETNADALRWFPMSAHEDRLLRLIDQLESTLKELRQAVQERPTGGRPQRREAVEAFADEAFRARDA